MAIDLSWCMEISVCFYFLQSAKRAKHFTANLIVKTAAKEQRASYKNIFVQANHECNFVMRTKHPDMLYTKVRKSQVAVDGTLAFSGW